MLTWYKLDKWYVLIMWSLYAHLYYTRAPPSAKVSLMDLDPCLSWKGFSIQEVCANNLSSYPSLGWERCKLRQTGTRSCIKFSQSICGIDLRNKGSSEGICLTNEQLDLDINMRIYNREPKNQKKKTKRKRRKSHLW